MSLVALDLSTLQRIIETMFGKSSKKAAQKKNKTSKQKDVA